MVELTQNNFTGQQSYGASEAEGGKLGVIQLLGGGLGNYATSSLSYVAVDSTLLQQTVMVPKGFVLMITASGVCGASTGAAQTVATAIAVDGVVQQESQTRTTTTANALIGFSNQYMVVGDGLAHTIALMYRAASPAAGNAVIGNNTATHVPQLTLELTQSNIN
jgi:hypothetical protein